MSVLMSWIAMHSLAVLLGIGTLFTYYWLLRFQKKLNLNWYSTILFSILHTIWGVLCVKTFAFAESGFDISAAGNMSLFGGVFFMPLFYWAMSKILHLKTGDVFDLCTNCMLFTVMCARINCIITGCCKGNLIFNTGLRWPTREAEVIFYIVLILIIRKKIKSGRTNGGIYPYYMISYGIFRFVMEWLRFHSGTSMIHPAHIWSLISLCLGFSIDAEMQNKRKGGDNNG